MRTQEERDEQTLVNMSAVFGVALLVFLVVLVIGVVVKSIV